MKRHRLVALFGTLGMVFFCVETWAGPAGGGSFQAIAVDDNGNKVAAGYIHSAASVRDFIVAKFDAGSGAEQWRRVISGTNVSPGDGLVDDGARAVAVDADGNVIAAGAIRNTGTAGDVLVVKFDGSSGTELWRQIFNGSSSTNDIANAVALDSAGDVFIAGYTANVGTSGDFTVIKLDGVSGAVLWHQAVNGSANSFDHANAIAVDCTDNVVVAGLVATAGFPRDFTVVKFDGNSGAELWRQNARSSRFPAVWGEARSVTTDTLGDVLVAGETSNPNASFTGSFVDFTVMKLQGLTGVELWRQAIHSGRFEDSEYALAVTVDRGGNAIAAGYFTGPISSDFAVAKFHGLTGVELWRNIVKGGSSARDNRALAIVTDRVGNVVAAGFATKTSSFIGDFAVIKFDGTTGIERWRQWSVGTGRAEAVGIDGRSTVLAAGDVGGYATVVEIGAKAGTERRRDSIIGSVKFGNDVGQAVAGDGASDVAAAGFVSSGSPNFFYTESAAR